MMPPVKRVHVAPFNYDVRYDKEAMRAVSANGICLEDQLVIMLAPDNAMHREQETLLHECLHAVWGQTFMDVKYPDEESDSEGEAIIRELAPRILALLRDNPKLVEFLVRSLP
jgi:hypothetical protein